MTKFESIVNCPICKGEVEVVLNAMEGEMLEIARGIYSGIGLGVEDSDRYNTEELVKCKCGKQIVVSMTVTAM